MGVRPSAGEARSGRAIPMQVDTIVEAFAADVARDLRRTPKQLQSQYLYDTLGSSLFEAICRLPWYRITRSEAQLLSTHAGAIAARLTQPRSAAGVSAIIELGVGSGEKLATILDAFPGGLAPRVHLIDISPAALEATAARVARFTRAQVIRHEGTYEQGLADAARAAASADRRLLLFLGSNIGNFDATRSRSLVQAMRRALVPGDLLLLGADLVKAEADLLLAYDDPLGVTAAFNRNLLVRINRELGGDFDLSGFEHRALWNAHCHRVEMHLVSVASQRVTIKAVDLTVEFTAGETIWTESSYKYTQSEIERLAGGAGFRVSEQWLDPDAHYALSLLEAH